MKTISKLFIILLSIAFCGCDSFVSNKQNITSDAIINSNQDSASVNIIDTTKSNSNDSTRQFYKTILGRFKEIQTGDYVHFVMIDETGKYVSFYFWKDSKVDKKLFSEFENGKHINEKVKVYWIEKKVYIPEAGNYENIEIIVDVNLLK